MIVIHDIEGDASDAIKAFKDPTRAGSSHYVVGYDGSITQMVREQDIAWHAGNWDYNTRAIGIEHAGFAYASPSLYTSSEYIASAMLSASICSRWGVPMDRAHVIGHYQVPDPNDPTQFGGSDHHTDPGPAWSWDYYMAHAVYYASTLPSPPHMVLTPQAYSGNGTATVHWQAARTCTLPVDHYTVDGQPGNLHATVSGSATVASFSGLTNGTGYTFTVTAFNQDGQDSVTSTTATPGPPCTSTGLSASPASPQSAGVAIRFTATSSGCSNPQYQFFLQDANLNWVVQQKFGANSWSWDSYHDSAGVHTIRVWANHASADPGSAEAATDFSYTLTPFSMSHWQAGYTVNGVPTSWLAGQSQTFPVTVTNKGDAAWPSTGFGEVDLDLHFATSAGGAPNQAAWLNSKAYSLPADLAPGATVTLNVTFAPPPGSGPMVLEAEMIKEHQFWFQQWSPVNVMVAAPDRTAAYDMSKVPTTWTPGQSQTFPVTVTNTSNQAWVSTGSDPVDLDLHFATSSGGYPNLGNWLNSTAFSLPADVAPGANVTVNVTFAAPNNSGPMVLEAEMIKEHQFWFQQWSSVPVTVTGPTWSATYDMSKAPATWAGGQTQTFPVTVTNTGNQTWPSTGYYAVELDLHFTTVAGGSSQQANWLTSQAFSIPSDVSLNGSVTVNVAVTAPFNTGSLVLEAEMIKEHQFWFTQVSSVSVTVTGPTWSASYDMSKAPTSWVAGQSQTFPVTVTNTGNQTWPSTGYNAVDFDLHFTTVAGGASQQASWLNSQAFSIPADLAPSAIVTFSVTLAAPSNTGSLVLEAEMIKEHQFWFTQVASVNTTVAAPVWSATYDLSKAPTTWTVGQSQAFPVTVTNNGNQTWPSTGYYNVDIDLHFTTAIGGSVQQGSWLTSQAFSIPGDLKPGSAVTVTVTVTAPSGKGSMFLEVEMIKEHQFWFTQVASVAVTVA